MPKDVLGYVTEHIKRSPLYNPYKEGSFILKWAIYKHQTKKGVLDVVRGQRTRKTNDEQYEGRNIIKSAPNRVLPVITPNYYREIRSQDFDRYIPKWDITLAELQELYDDARFERYLEWSYWMQSLGTQPTTRWSAWRKLEGKWRQCYSMAFKRRIPWLYPENGKLFL